MQLFCPIEIVAREYSGDVTAIDLSNSAVHLLALKIVASPLARWLLLVVYFQTAFKSPAL